MPPRSGGHHDNTPPTQRPKEARRWNSEQRPPPIFRSGARDHGHSRVTNRFGDIVPGSHRPLCGWWLRVALIEVRALGVTFLTESSADALKQRAFVPEFPPHTLAHTWRQRKDGWPPAPTRPPPCS